MTRPSTDNFYVYALCRDIELLDPFYIGKGKKKRMHDHGREKLGNSLKHNAIRKRMAEFGFVPSKIIASGLSETEAFALEIHWIQFYGRIDKGTGVLTNATDGGEGVSGRVYTEAERKIRREIMQKVNQDPAVKARVSAQFKGVKKSEETRAKMREAARIRNATLAWKTAISEANRARGSEFYAAVGMKNRGRVFSDETREKMSESARKRAPRKWPEAQYEKMSVALTGQKRSEASREKMRISSRARWDRVKAEAAARD